MINVDPENPASIGHYPLKSTGDLLAIACWGTDRAWVAGDGGTLLATEDAGATWRVVDSGVKTRLRAVALPAQRTVYVAGDEGLLRMSTDAGVTWRAVASPLVTWTSVAGRADGSRALLTTQGTPGKVFRLDGTVLTEVASAPAGGLNGVAMASDGTAVAVGDGGVMLVSRDGGDTWRTRPSGTTRTLRAVRLVADGQSLFAVGDGGVLVEGPPDRTEAAVPRNLGADLTLRGINLEPSGHGAIVGDRGLVMFTRDFGASWSRVATGEERNIFSVDALGDDD
jgi:photosystem II stability/assembly factor-like uncharacterized protein